MLGPPAPAPRREEHPAAPSAGRAVGDALDPETTRYYCRRRYPVTSKATRVQNVSEVLHANIRRGRLRDVDYSCCEPAGGDGGGAAATSSSNRSANCDHTRAAASS